MNFPAAAILNVNFLFDPNKYIKYQSVFLLSKRRDENFAEKMILLSHPVLQHILLPKFTIMAAIKKINNKPYYEPYQKTHPVSIA